MKFEHVDQRKTEVTVEPGRLIGRGGFGAVYETDVMIGGRHRTMVLKKFHDNELGTPEENARRAFKNYSLAKEAGLKVFPTYRLGEDGSSILMTDGRAGVWFCAAGNNNEQSYRIVEIDNLKDILEKLAKEAAVAAAANLNLKDDMLFFTVDRCVGANLDFYLGDLDLLRDAHRSNQRSIWGDNLRQLRAALGNFIRIYAREPRRYLEMVESFFSEAFRKLEDSYRNGSK